MKRFFFVAVLMFVSASFNKGVFASFSNKYCGPTFDKINLTSTTTIKSLRIYPTIGCCAYNNTNFNLLPWENRVAFYGGSAGIYDFSIVLANPTYGSFLMKNGNGIIACVSTEPGITRYELSGRAPCGGVYLELNNQLCR